MNVTEDIRLDELVALFPLPNVVLFPHAILPLHVFEQRYRRMMNDVLDGSGQIAIALLKPGWETNYYAQPRIEPTVCVGKVVRYERLDDGRFNLLLQGCARCMIDHENTDLAYRRAELEPVPETRVLEIDLGEQRRRIEQLFDDGSLGDSDLTRALRKLLDSAITTEALADILAFAMIPDAQVKQSLLADGDVLRRVEHTVDVIAKLRAGN